MKMMINERDPNPTQVPTHNPVNHNPCPLDSIVTL